jgi:hypothetical protein
MPQVWTPDDLQFADVRAAHLESAEQVAGDLLAAAGQPRSRLKGVSVTQARLRAAELLIAAEDRHRAANIARQVLQDVRGRPEKLAAACMLAKAGDEDAAQALATPALTALQDRPGEVVIMDAVALALGLADGGQSELAARVADEATAAYARWKAGPGRRADRNGTLGNMAGLARQTVLHAHQDLQELITGQRVDEPGMQPSMLLPWPALFGSCLLWWPEAEYQRIVRQVPDVRLVLGATWREHTATVESAMLTLVPSGPVSRPGGATAYSLVAADFESFCGYLQLTGADPRRATTMTGYTARLIDLAESGVRRQPIPWPPAERSRCWCGSNACYGRCCRRHS